MSVIIIKLFDAESQGGGEGGGEQGGGEGGDPSSCALHLWFNSATDRSAAGIEQNDPIFSVLVNTSANAISGSITIDEHVYNVTARTSNGTPVCEFDIPSGQKGDFYMVAVSGGSNARTVRYSKDGGTDIEIGTVSSKTEGSNITAFNLTAGHYIISASGNIGIGLFGLMLCPNSVPATGIDEVATSTAARKLLRDGGLLIQRDNKIYNAQGQLIR
jgi:hypothetical protein